MIHETTRTVYYSSVANRHFMTQAAAIKAEARALIKRRYPTEDSERDDCGNLTYAGFYWRNLPHSEKLYRRMILKVKSAWMQRGIQ